LALIEITGVKQKISFVLEFDVLEGTIKERDSMEGKGDK
jgi:hypothetical protein